ncbi:MAG: biotin--[acetyl-CoA-carboxylase] ligase [Ruminococcaceae bacterium]|nr:biotin--[acetyl-CoA-carboxylase] ligase [Oscillospiraceae bacterium]
MVSFELPHCHPWADKIHCFDCVDSTNTLAKQMALQGAPHGTVLIADRQTAGRGRLGRSFLSPGGMGLYMSVILRYDCAATELMHLTCACGVGACNAVEAVTGIRPGIKWINDLVVGTKKLAGILTELVFTGNQVCAIVGIGINCRQRLEDFDPAIRDMATSLATVTGEDVSTEVMAAAVLQALYQMDGQLFSKKKELLSQYRADCITLDNEIRVVQGENSAYGHAIDILEDGTLLVAFTDGTQRAVNSGEVSVRGMYGYV